MIALSRLSKAMHEIAARKGDFTLFSLFRRANGLGRWDLVISAPWLEKDRYTAQGEFVDLLASSIGRRNLAEFARVQTLPAANPGVKFILANYPVEDGEIHLKNPDMFPLEIHEAIILRAQKPARKKVRKPAEPVAAKSVRARR